MNDINDLTLTPEQIKEKIEKSILQAPLSPPEVPEAAPVPENTEPSV